MFDKYHERERGALGYVLNGDKLTTLVRRLTEVDNAFPACGTYALVYGSGERWAVVNGEGVGNVAEGYDDTSIVYWVRRNAPEPGADGRIVEMVDIWLKEVEVSFNDVEQCLTGETVDLADHIRMFGDRLDRNHRIWVNFSGWSVSV